MSEPPHQVPFEAWNMQLRPNGWDDLGPVLQSDDLEGGDSLSAISGCIATVDCDQYNNAPNGTAGDGSSILQSNVYGGYSFLRSNIAPAIAAPNLCNNHGSSAFDHLQSISGVTSDFNLTTGFIKHATPFTFGSSYINNNDPKCDVADGPALQDVYGSFVPTWSSMSSVDENTDQVASTFNHGSAPYLLPQCDGIVPAVPAAGFATTLANPYGSWDPRTFDQNTAPPLPTVYSSFTPTANFISVPTPSFDGYDTCNPIYNAGYSALPMQSLHAGDTNVPEDGLSPNVNADTPTRETSVASKELKSKYICAVCNENQYHEGGLRSHARRRKHAIYQCEGCNEKFYDPVDRRDHQLEAHVTDHGRMRSISAHTCDECDEVFNSQADLHRHAREQRHAAYACKCNQTFSRADVLERHLDQYLPGKPKYPCPHCKRHRGDNAFKRKQHLTQHLRGYHHIGAEINSSWGYHSLPQVCPHPECPEYRGPEFQDLSSSERQNQKPFRNQGEFTKHMREAHDESSFPCDIAHCPRVRGKGYFRENDFLKHRKNQHPDAPPYVLSERSVLHSCRELECDRKGKNGFKDRERLWYHYKNSHRYDQPKASDLSGFRM